MAESPSHKYGQIIGNLLEEITYPLLKKFSDERGFYLDKAGERGKARAGKKVMWRDKYENDHDLDFVIEDGGSKDVRGRPVAFIEVAWRRYTKHSRNKAQEIQGAILPIAEHYYRDSPFLGAVLAGQFTIASIRQMESVGFNILYFPYETIISAFDLVGVDAKFDEGTPDKKFIACIGRIESLSQVDRTRMKQRVVDLNKDCINNFVKKLDSVLSRTVAKILICPLFGYSAEFNSVDDAITFFDTDFTTCGASDFRKIEIVVVYSNSDRIEGSFLSTEKAIDFLKYAKK